MMGKGLLFVVSGPSGTGKGTICKSLVENTNIALSVSMTTRPPRADEIDGKNYYFVSEEEFIKVVEDDGFLEYALVYGHYYGTPKQAVFNMLDKGRDVVLEIDIQGALKIKEVWPKGVFIFILPPSMTELRKRITGRGSESQCDIDIRIGEALNEVSYIDKYDYCVVNDKVECAVEKIIAIINAEHYRVSEDIYSLIENYKEEL
ncbi:MAG: guanylate kinase [Eubacteriales bacterium]